ncbi:neuronal pentraxin-2-like [Macrobrachium nipponense]|uniref:neuronal pentraxin-2-like n=1 Tax=Macrobrachium nipponense TaxID=159736 RepID=UPI0030C7BFA1
MTQKQTQRYPAAHEDQTEMKATLYNLCLFVSLLVNKDRRGMQHGFYYNGVRQFGFITNFTSPVWLNEWTHYCHIFEEGFYKGYVKGEKKATGKVVSDKTIAFNGIITFGQEQDIPAGGYAVDQCFRGYFSQFNIWKKVITEGEI